MVSILPPRLIAERAAAEVTRLDGDTRQIQHMARLHSLREKPETIDALDAASTERAFWNGVRMLAEEAALAQPARAQAGVAEKIADAVCREVCELPDRTSPEDWPEALLVTSDELHAIVKQTCADALAALNGGE